MGQITIEAKTGTLAALPFLVCADATNHRASVHHGQVCGVAQLVG